MQASEAEIKSSLCSDDSINFRPSPNFKHMKKYLKSKFEEANQSESNTMTDSSSHDKQEKVNNTTVQPPLPPNPPPPDSPVSAIKQEIIDDDYQSVVSNSADSSDLNQSESNQQTPSEEPITTEPEETMCRNFVRGTCKKGTACIFLHKLILSQLRGVYTFCRNFQNRGCTYTKCKFVHATVFEKEHFFRTGFLPPHTTAHLKQSQASPTTPGTAAPAQPTPPAEPTAETPQQVPPQMFPAPPYTFDPNAPPAPVMPCPPVAEVNANVPEMYRPPAPPEATVSTLKRAWGEGEDFSRVIPDALEPVPKKCKNCSSSEFRFQYVKEKFERMIVVTKERKEKSALLNKKIQKLSSLLMAVINPMNNGLNILNPNLSMTEEHMKAILEHIRLMQAEVKPMFESNKPSTVSALSTILGSGLSTNDDGLKALVDYMKLMQAEIKSHEPNKSFIGNMFF